MLKTIWKPIILAAGVSLGAAATPSTASASRAEAGTPSAMAPGLHAAIKRELKPAVASSRTCPECDDEELAYYVAFATWLIWDYDLGYAWDNFYICQGEAQLLSEPVEEYCADQIEYLEWTYAGWLGSSAEKCVDQIWV
jgi:hypothetical protein